MKIKDGFVLRSVAGNHVVVPMGQQAVSFNGMITLNDTAAFLWQLLSKDTTEEAMVAALLEDYDVTFDQAKESVHQFVMEVKENHFLDE